MRFFKEKATVRQLITIAKLLDETVGQMKALTEFIEQLEQRVTELEK
jgi:hypothetical protein